MISFQRYRQFFRLPLLADALLASVPGRIPIGMAGLAILLFVQGKSGSFAQAGATSALYVLGLAVVAPFLGRLIDRAGPRHVLVTCATVYPLALCALVVLVSRTAHPILMAACAFVAGAALPPITICMRALYPRVVSDAGLLQTAYSIDSALIETIFILGPALVALFVAAGSPAGAVLLAALCALIGGMTFARSTAVRHWTAHLSGAARRAPGLFRCPALLAVFAATLMYAMAFGLFEVAVTAFAAQNGRPAAAGVTLALASVGSAAGALVYGSRSWSPPLPRQFLMGLGLMALGTLLLAPIANLYAFAVFSVLAGAPMATVIAAQAMLVSRISPREMLAESFTWGSTCLLGGISGGIALGGILAEHAAPPAILIAASLATALAGLVVWFALCDAPGARDAEGRGLS